jgi:hypothetical protein
MAAKKLLVMFIMLFHECMIVTVHNLCDDELILPVKLRMNRNYLSCNV